MKRTTIMVEEGPLTEVQYQARLEGKTLAALIQAALAEYITAHRMPQPLPAFVGMGHSGDGTISQRDEEILSVEIVP